jgi:tetratricopeptide (TPR) repeat protein
VDAWLATGPEGKAFVWVHFFDPHAPYAPPRPWTAAFDRDAYRGEVATTDHELGILLHRFDEHFDAKLRVVTADHGESLGEHQEETHGVFVYESTTRVPLILSGDAVAAGSLVGTPVPLTAVAATIAAAGGADARDFPVGPLPPAATDDDALYAESMYPRLRHGWSELRAFRTAEWKVILAPHPEAYDLARDPGETRNLWEETGVPTSVDSLLEELEQEPYAFLPPAAAPDPEVEERLASLGYASVTAAPEDDRPDPKDRVLVERALGRAGGLLESGNLIGARSALAAVRQRDPRNKEAQILLARVEGASGNPERARQLLDDALRLPPRSMDRTVHYEAGRLELDAGRLDEAERRFEATVQLDPLDVDARFNWGLAAYRAGRFGDAATRWREVLRLDPTHPNATKWVSDAEQRSAAEAGP